MDFCNVIFFLLMIAPGIAVSGVIVTPTRIIYNENSTAQNIILKNNDEKNYLVSVFIEEKGQKWFVITPPIIRLEGGGKLMMRIRQLNNEGLPSDRESMFNYSITMIGSEKTPSKNMNRIAVASRHWFKLFYRPEKIGIPKKNSCSLGVDKVNGDLLLTNNNPFYATLAFLSINGKRVTLNSEESMVEPYSSRSFKIAGDISVVEWININDYGVGEDKCMYSFQ